MNKIEALMNLFECDEDSAKLIINRVEEADLSVDTDLSKNDRSVAEEKLLDLISISKSLDSLDGIQLDTTSKGNIRVSLGGKDLLTISGNQFSEEELEDLRNGGFFGNETSLEDSETLVEESDGKKAAIDYIMSVTNFSQEQAENYINKLIADSEDLKRRSYAEKNKEELEKEWIASHTNEDGAVDWNGWEDFVLSKMNESENLTETTVPASNMDFKHQQLGQVQDMIKVIAELKAEDNSNTLYTELLDGYDKLIKILTDAITEDPVGTVVGDGFNTGLQSQETSEEVPEEEPTESLEDEPAEDEELI